MTPGKWLRATAVIVVTMTLFFALGLPLLRSYILAHPLRRVAELTEARAGAPVERVTFTALDGVELVGWFVAANSGGAGTAGDNSGGDGSSSSGERRPAIVASHGLHASGVAHYPGVAFLRDAGYHVFVFDHRAHGQSGGRVTTLGPREVHDLRGAIAYLRSRPDVDPTRIGVIGCSMGSAVVIGAAAQDAAIRAVVAEAVYADTVELYRRFGYVGIRGTSIEWSLGALRRAAARLWTGYPVETFRPVELIAGISPRPVLLIHGEYDNGSTTVGDARRLYQAAGAPKELWIVPGGGHCDAHARYPEAYEERVRAFFDKGLGVERDGAR
jgi:fermentation-respiration switch protein FrsA (DUF1100 family)